LKYFPLQVVRKYAKAMVWVKVDFIPGRRLDFIALKLKYPIQVLSIAIKTPAKPKTMEMVVSREVIFTIFSPERCEFGGTSSLPGR
jgi:hypothetical protein